jgi:uncharacterized protein (DUF302 family)
MQPIVRASRFSYSETLTRLGIEIALAGATISCKLDQSRAARAAGLALRPTTLFILGNPEAETRVMDAVPVAGLDLPLKILVWEDTASAQVAFLPARALCERYDLALVSALLDAVDDRLRRIVAAIATGEGASPS